MRDTDLTRMFADAAWEWGWENVTPEDAVLAYSNRPDRIKDILDDGRGDDSDVQFNRCEDAVVWWLRPGRWDRW